MPNVNLSTRALVVALKAPSGGAKTSAEISAATGIPVRTINKIYSRAKKRGFMPYARPLALRDEQLADAPRSGRPPTRKKDEEGEGEGEGGRKKRKKMGRPKKVVSKDAPVTAAGPLPVPMAVASVGSLGPGQVVGIPAHGPEPPQPVPDYGLATDAAAAAAAAAAAVPESGPLPAVPPGLAGNEQSHHQSQQQQLQQQLQQQQQQQHGSGFRAMDTTGYEGGQV